MSTAVSSLDNLVAKAGQLYSLPAVAMKVLELTNNPQVDLFALKQCIENDPALTTKVLRVVNSSLFGLSREVSDLNQALALLGIKPLKLLVLGFSLPERLFQGVAAHILERYWRHALTKAVAAREISETVCRQNGDEAFIAGLLQDLGILLLIQEVRDPYIQFLEEVYAKCGDLASLETEVMGFDHTMLTSRLLDRWNLPDLLVHAVCPRAASETAASSTPAAGPLQQILYSAELVAQLLAEGRTNVLGQLLTVGGQSHGLSREQLEELVGRLQEKVEQLAAVLSLRLHGGYHYEEVLAEAYRQLTEVAAEAAGDLIRHQSAEQGPPSQSECLSDELRALSEAVARVSQPGQGAVVGAADDAATPEPVIVESPHRQGADSAARSAPSTAHAARAGWPTAAEADPGLLGRLAASVSACRKSHSPLTLLLVELDDVDDLIITCGVEGLQKIRGCLETACRKMDHPYVTCLSHREMGFAIILPDCERQLAVQLASQLVNHVRRLTPDHSSPGRSALSVSVGAATLSVPTKNFPPEDLVNGAERCLYGSHTSGGVVKSIEIY